MVLQKLNAVLNITSTEWPRIIVAWSINFLLRFGFILGWTLIVATFLNKMGIQYLPILFLGNALLVMGGTLIYRNFIHKIRREVLISFSLLLGAGLLIASLFFSRNHGFTYLLLLLITEGVILSQVYILASIFFEELFTPLESQRTFPIIESAELVGTIAGGLVLSLFATSLAPYKFIAIWATALVMILPIVLFFNSRTMEIPKLQSEEDMLKELKRKSFFDSFKEIKKIPFLKGLMWVVLINWALMNIVEFQYTKAIQMEVLRTNDLAAVNPEESLMQKLGTLHVIFSSAALMIQLIMASRILSGLGIVSSMLLHPIVTFLNGLVISLRYGFVTASITRGTFELTNLIFSNAYNSSYYAIPHHIRDEAKELIQGIVKPLGALIGTTFILVAAELLNSEISTFVLNMLLITLSITMAVCISDLSKKYTDMSEQNLGHKLDIHTRLNAIEILAQNGHGKFPASLKKILTRSGEETILKEKILITIARRQDTDSLSTVLSMLNNKEDSIRSAAVKTIMDFHTLEKRIFDQSLTRYFTIQHLKKAIEEEKNHFVREQLVKALYNITPDELTEFVIKSIESNSEFQAEFIKLLSLFKDPNLIPYLEPYLKHKSAGIRAACIISLWQFKRIRPLLSHVLNQLLKSKNKNTILAGMEAAGLIRNYKVKHVLTDELGNRDREIAEGAILALARLDDKKILPEILKRITDENHKWHKNKNYILESFSKKYSEDIRTSINLFVIEKINVILSRHRNQSIEVMEKEVLKQLLKLYREIDAHHESYKIEKILKRF